MANQKPAESSNPLHCALGWVDKRFPLVKMWKEHASEYYAPKNFNFWYFFGSLAALVLVIQIVTGIFLVMHYRPDATNNASGVSVAFESVELFTREVFMGDIIRNMHSTGASMFFVVVYLHMFRGLLYGSYRKPRELVWLFGVGIFLALMGEAFFGYLLPWGQMSFWGAQVIVNLFAAIPVIGDPLSTLIRGDFNVSGATLNRFFSFHVIALPLIIVGLVAAHIIALHEVGSNNPDGVEIKEKKDANGIPLDGIPFHPFYTVHDIWVASMFAIIFFAIVFFAPELGGYFLERPNFVPANANVTPNHIAPVWYFTPFYSMLRGTTAEFVRFVMVPAVVIGAVGFVYKSLSKSMKPIALIVPVLFLLVIVSLAIPDLKDVLELHLVRFYLTIGPLTLFVDTQVWSAAYWLAFCLGLLCVLFCNALNLVSRVIVAVIVFVITVALIFIEAKFWGVAVMGGGVLILAGLPWLDQSPVKSIRYRPTWHFMLLLVFVVDFIQLGYWGVQAPSPLGERLSQIGAAYYFGFFLLMPIWSQMGSFKKVPDRVKFKPH